MRILKMYSTHDDARRGFLADIDKLGVDKMPSPLASWVNRTITLPIGMTIHYECMPEKIIGMELSGLWFDDDVKNDVRQMAFTKLRP